MMRLAFTVPGRPQPKGSARAFVRGGRAVVTSDNPKARVWANAITAAAADEMGDAPLWTGPVRLRVLFSFARPKGHYRTGKRAAELREDAPTYHAQRSDCDKLLRALGDALTGVVWRDDAQVASLIAAKVWSDRDETEIEVEGLE